MKDVLLGILWTALGAILGQALWEGLVKDKVKKLRKGKFEDQTY